MCHFFLVSRQICGQYLTSLDDNFWHFWLKGVRSDFSARTTVGNGTLSTCQNYLITCCDYYLCLEGYKLFPSSSCRVHTNRLMKFPPLKLLFSCISNSILLKHTHLKKSRSGHGFFAVLRGHLFTKIDKVPNHRV